MTSSLAQASRGPHIRPATVFTSSASFISFTSNQIRTLSRNGALPNVFPSIACALFPSQPRGVCTVCSLARHSSLGTRHCFTKSFRIRTEHPKKDANPARPERSRRERASRVEGSLAGAKFFLTFSHAIPRCNSFRMCIYEQTPRFARFWPKLSVRNFFKIRTYKSCVYNPFRMCTYKKQGWGGGARRPSQFSFARHSPLDTRHFPKQGGAGFPVLN